jgi:hypothetical protein
MTIWKRGSLIGLFLLGIAAFSEIATAHTGSLSLGQDPPPVPLWLTLMTGGGVIGMSFLFTSQMTDHELIRLINQKGASVTGERLQQMPIRSILGWVGVLVLGVVVVTGLVGPSNSAVNLAILIVWVGWWAGYTMSVYLLGNSWPAFNPWRMLAEFVPRPDEGNLPERFGVWPSVIGLLGLVYLEVVTPVAEDPRLLAGVILGYSVVTLTGAAVYGPSTWFDRVDPIARIFRYYGLVAPIQRTADGFEFRLPGAAVVEHSDLQDVSGTAFVIAILWVTTYDGVVSTPLWASLIGPVIESDVPAFLVYLLALLAGYGLFLGLYLAGSRIARDTAETYLKPTFIGRRLAPSLLPIAAGYHLAHFLGYFLSLLPALVVVLGTPLAPPSQVPLLTIPGWFGPLQLLFVLIGHVMAVWVAHSIAFDLFSGRLQPIRSQYPFIALMIFYTMVSMWIVTSPTGQPPYL